MSGVIGCGAFGRPVPFPLDAFSGPSALAAWGTMAWTKTAVGQAMVDASGSTYSGASSGFCSGTFSGQRVSKYYDQVSGTYYADQATTANMPTIWPSPIDGWPEIKWHQRLGTASTGKYLTVEGGLTVTSTQAYTLVWVQRGCAETIPNNITAFSYETFWLGCRPGGSAYWGLWGSVSEAAWTQRSWLFCNGASLAQNAPHKPSLKYAVHVMVCTGSGCAHFVDGVKTTIAVTPGGGSLSNLYMGWYDTATQTDNVAVLGAAAFNSALSDAQAVEITGLIHKRLYGGSPSMLLYIDGTSIEAGYDVTVTKDLRDQSWGYLLVNTNLASSRKKITGVNMGVASSELSAVVGSEHVLLNNQAAKVNAFLGSSSIYTKKLVILGAPTNDIYYGDTAANILANMVTYRNAALAAGADECFVCNVIPRQTFNSGMKTVASTLNSSIASTFGSAVIDIASLNWQPGGASDWTTCYQDGTHPNAAGRALIAGAAAPKVGAYL